MPLASLTSVANSPVSRRRISSFGSSTFTVLSKFFGSLLRSQRIFGAVKPVRAGLATISISFLRPPARRLDFLALGGGALVVPQQCAADDAVVLVEEHGAVHLAGKADRADVGRLELGLLHDGAHGFHRGLPPVVRVLLTPQRFGMVARVGGHRLAEDFAALVDGERFGAGRADVDAEVDAHCSDLRELKH